MITYGFSKELNVPFKEALELVMKKLKEAGFGVITTIDLKEKFKEKLGIDFKNYVILGACHPGNAHKAILAEENVGLLLPCNVIVYEKGTKTAVSMIKPLTAMGMIDNDELKSIVAEVEEKLKKVFDSIK